MPPLDPALAARLAAVALANVGREYPFHLVHLAHADNDLRPPRALHPVFGASYDWHSCVHMHWTLARLLRLAPHAVDAAAIARHFDDRFTPARVEAEIAYLRAPGRAAFERPYGWAWLLELATELDRLAAGLPAARRWQQALAPLAAYLVQAFIGFLPRAAWPVRAGTHGNSAFALILAHDHATHAADRALANTIADTARRWFGADHAYPAAYEPSGDDFLSPGLCEALLMARVLGAAGFRAWWERFAPPSVAPWLTPVAVSDDADPKIVHLHGLNLSRAWCWRQLAPLLPPTLQPTAIDAAQRHLAASLPAATAGDYVGTHWLATFAVLALSLP